MEENEWENVTRYSILQEIEEQQTQINMIDDISKVKEICKEPFERRRKSNNL